MKQDTEEILVRKRRSAESMLRSLTDAKEAELNALVAAYKESIYPDLNSRHDPGIEVARIAASVAAEEDISHREKSPSKHERFSPGQKVLEWAYIHDWSTSSSIMKPTGKSGIVETLTRKSVRPTNVRVGDYEYGMLVVRPLSKNGDPGRSFLSGYKADHWYPEGVDPNKIKK